MRSCLAVALFAVACKSGSSPPAKGSNAPSGSAVAQGSGSAAGSGSAGAADPWAKAPDKPLTPEERKKKAEAAIARVATVQVEVAALRGLPLPKPVPAEIQSTDDFRKFVHHELEKELPKEKATKIADAQVHLGLFKKALDLDQILEQTMISQAAAYYDPEAKKFFMVMIPDNDMMLDTISAHELTHAVQDENFDLKKFLPSTLDDDGQTARKFLVEGDATFAMIAYLAAHASHTKDLSPAMFGLIKTQVTNMANTSIADYGEMMKQQAGMLQGMDADLKKSMESMNELPPIVIRPLIDSYMKGAVVSLTAYEKGGWKAVDELYKHPPSSTEQVLHPAEKLVGKRDEPKQVKLGALPKGDELTNNVMGELQWQIYLDQWGVKNANDAAAGWGGDRYSAIKREDGEIIGFLATTWDTPKDAKEFYDAYVESLKGRFPAADNTKPEAGVARTDKGKVFVKLVGNNVFIVDGGDDPKLLDQLAKTTTIK